MKPTLDRFKLANMLESENSRDKLASAGYRGQAPLIAFMFFRFVMPSIVFVVALFYLFVITHFHWSPMMKFSAAFAGALLGYYLPDMFVSNVTTRRQQSIMRAFPDALDLMLICVESGMSIETAFSKRGRRDRHPVGRTGGRTGPDHRRTLLSARPPPGLRQSRQALRPFRRQGGGDRAQPGREIRHARWARRCASPPRKTAKCAWQEAERKAASLPAKLTVPMILFFLPCLFVVILARPS